MKKLILFLLVYLFSQNLHAQATTVQDHARGLLELTGSGKIGIQVINNMIASYKKQITGVPADFWDEFAKEIRASEIVDLLVPVYVKHYTDDEMIQLIAFYKTPLGKKLIEKAPLISQDSFVIGQEWGRKIGEKVATKLKDKGFLQN